MLKRHDMMLIGDRRDVLKAQYVYSADDVTRAMIPTQPSVGPMAERKVG